MISPIIGTPGTSATSSTLGAGGLGRDEFLKLLVTQLRNQDPLSPLAPHEFAAQLAQFSSVEQLTQLNDAVALQSQAVEYAALIGKTAFSAALIGKSVAVAGDRVVIPESGAAKLRFEVGGSGGRATLKLFDDSGHEVATRELGSLAPGRQSLTLPQDLPPGRYRYTIEIKDADDAAVPVTTYTTGNVDGVYFKNGEIVLRIGGSEIPLDDLAEIENAS